MSHGVCVVLKQCRLHGWRKKGNVQCSLRSERVSCLTQKRFCSRMFPHYYPIQYIMDVATTQIHMYFHFNNIESQKHYPAEICYDNQKRWNAGSVQTTFFPITFFKQGWAVIWQRVKHSKALHTSQIFPFLPAILMSSWRDTSQLFCQVNTPGTRKGGAPFENMEANRERVLRWRLPLLLIITHSNVSKNS